ncbi:tetratricopeptide repeat (TPR)-like superfamily protein [Artemisia annua]|uniref:Tetratricopeptide repeat (TPR)-like superfamily protein n=1 Tax=Artemisia annua TaxID=35608 RepID=A0A2U1NB21_ARTAN|nr:tetratricopeptide repeat (TPR)-like superfamily protein [Artemisia annua]
MDDAMLLYHEMNEKGLKPNYLTCITMLLRLFSAARFGDARKRFDEMRAQGYMLDQSTYHGILMILGSEQRIDLGLSLFRLVGDSELNANISVYNELIVGAIQCEKFDIAWHLFNELSVKGMKPDYRTYTAMIHAFSTIGILDDAKKMFSEMEESDYKPNSNNYNDLLEGHLLKKRYDDVDMLLHKMAERGFHLNVTTWTLLHQFIAAGSLNIIMLKLIGKLDPTGCLFNPIFAHPMDRVVHGSPGG